MCMDWARRGNRYDASYFERGTELGISGYTQYQWQPQRSHSEAAAFATAMGILPKDGHLVVDFGCAKGYFVRGMLELGFDAYGIDVSDYARQNCDPMVLGRLYSPLDNQHQYECGYVKDTLEHIAYEDIDDVLKYLALIARRWMIIVPLGNGKRFNIDEYECDVTHIIRENVDWWTARVEHVLKVSMASLWVSGLKDKWWPVNRFGNLVLVTS